MEHLSSISDKLTKTKFSLDDIEHQDERLLLDKYRLNIVELKAKKDEKLEDPEIAVSGDDENEDEIIDADLICKSMVKKRRDKSTKKELQNEMILLNKGQVKEPDFIYDGSDTLIKIGSTRFQNFLSLLHNNWIMNNTNRPRHNVCVTCWQFIGL